MSEKASFLDFGSWSGRTWTISLIAGIVALALLRFLGTGWFWAVVVGIVVFLVVAWFLQRKAAAEAAAAASVAAAYKASRAPEPAPVRPVVAPVAPATSSAGTTVSAGLAAADLGTGGASGASRPVGLPAPREGGPSNLKRIRGVGPKIEAMLHGLGYYHFDQIAAWSPSDVAWVDSNLEGFHGRASRDDWVGQAKILAAGGSTEFSARVDRGEVYDD
jgi:predicted flap endonuclease-1-like 5' DNA nuclease